MDIREDSELTFTSTRKGCYPCESRQPTDTSPLKPGETIGEILQTYCVTDNFLFLNPQSKGGGWNPPPQRSSEGPQGLSINHFGTYVFGI